MQHSLFDRIYLSFLMILIASFGILIVYTSYSSRNALIQEKQETLTNEATLIATQTIIGYLSGNYDIETLEESFNYYASYLDADIWYVNENGVIIAMSDNENMREVPKNIFFLDPDYNLTSQSATIGDFYEVFYNDMITVTIPLTLTYPLDDNLEDKNAGAVIVHAESSQINTLMTNIFGIIYIPCFVIIAISFAFLGTISRKVIQPIKHLSNVAGEYAKGNFEVKTEIETKDELGALAHSLELMADSLSKIEEYRREFISNISHDFRSPLTSIKGYIEAMLDGTIPVEKQERYLNIVLTETQRLTKLTNGLLDMNNLEKFGPYLKLSDFDIIEVIKSTLNTFEGKCIDKNIAIYLNNHALNTVVTADKTKIQQVFYNLIDNAIKFTPEYKKIYVTITEKNEKIYVSVKDEGQGMSEETQSKIWDRFFKGDASRGRDKQGTGLGLAIAREIMKAHNENIDVISTEGAGSEFKFSLTKRKLQDTDNDLQ